MTNERRLVTDGDPDSRFTPRSGSGEFWEAPDIERIAYKLIEAKLPDWPEDCKVRFLWKAKGGRSGGKGIYGKTVKAGGLVAYGMEADFVIWLAADLVHDMAFTNWQVEALLYHEMLHVGVEQDEDGKVSYSVIGHDFEGFRSEIAEYGFWSIDTKAIARTIQGRLALEEPGPEPVEIDYTRAQASFEEEEAAFENDDDESLPEIPEEAIAAHL